MPTFREKRSVERSVRTDSEGTVVNFRETRTTWPSRQRKALVILWINLVLQLVITALYLLEARWGWSLSQVIPIFSTLYLLRDYEGR